MQRGTVLQCVGLAFLVFTLRGILDAGAPKLVHIAWCVLSFAIVMRGASHSAGSLVALGDERMMIWFVLSAVCKLRRES